MTIQWTLIASFLYAEVALVVLLLLPFIPPRFWASLFQWRYFQAFARRANLYVTVFIAVLVMFFIDSVREMNKYSHNLSGADHVDAEIHLSVKLFRSQRNYYISGLALYLFLVIRRLIVLILVQAKLHKDIESTMQDAQEATDRAEKLMKDKNEQDLKTSSQNKEANERKHALEKELKDLSQQLLSVKEELQSVRNDLTTVKERSAAAEEEYDKLLQEHTLLQEKSMKLENRSESGE